MQGGDDGMRRWGCDDGGAMGMRWGWHATMGMACDDGDGMRRWGCEFCDGVAMQGMRWGCYDEDVTEIREMA